MVARFDRLCLSSGSFIVHEASLEEVCLGSRETGSTSMQDELLPDRIEIRAAWIGRARCCLLGGYSVSRDSFRKAIVFSLSRSRGRLVFSLSRSRGRLSRSQCRKKWMACISPKGHPGFGAICNSRPCQALVVEETEVGRRWSLRTTLLAHNPWSSFSSLRSCHSTLSHRTAASSRSGGCRSAAVVFLSISGRRADFRLRSREDADPQH